MDDLTVLIPKTIQVTSGREAEVTCPFCHSVVTVPAKTISRASSKELDVTCTCRRVFYVKFQVQKESLHGAKMIIKDLSSNHVYENFEIDKLDKSHCSFFCNGQHSFRRRQKVRVQIIRKGGGLSDSSKDAVIHLVRGQYVLCYFL